MMYSCPKTSTWIALKWMKPRGRWSISKGTCITVTTFAKYWWDISKIRSLGVNLKGGHFDHIYGLSGPLFCFYCMHAHKNACGQVQFPVLHNSTDRWRAMWLTRHWASKGRFKTIKTQCIQQVYEASRMHKICAELCLHRNATVVLNISNWGGVALQKLNVFGFFLQVLLGFCPADSPTSFHQLVKL